MAERPLTAKKRLGAYYTAPAAVAFLTDWGLSTAPGIVMDPSCGDGRFLAGAARRGATSLIGCDLDTSALAAADAELSALETPRLLHNRDFFQLDPEETGPVDLLLGNPPYIRFQQFSGDSRTRALASALRVGARLSRLSASWAPFLLHGLQFLRPGGAMAMVVPAELAQTSYGIETLRALCANFARIRVLAFRYNWFEDAQQETFLLLAEHRGSSCPSAELVPLDRIEDLALLGSGSPHDHPVPLDIDPDIGLGLAFLPQQTRELVEALLTEPTTRSLQSLGDITNGYVSGANDFFHCTRSNAESRDLPSDWLLPVARNSRSLAGLRFTSADLTTAERGGTAHHLILPRTANLSSKDAVSLGAFIQEGESAGIPKRYKCRVRHPWWRVPGLNRADVLLPYMIGSEPHAAVNDAHAFYPNSLHGIRLSDRATAPQVALGLLSSLSLLSMELVGRSYGGGILKLEPSEMQRVQLILPAFDGTDLEDRLTAADRLIRANDFDGAIRLVDHWLLEGQSGLSDQDIERLSQARAALLERRLTRARSRR